MTALFWIAIFTILAPDGSEALIASQQQPSRAACVEMISGEIGMLMQRAIIDVGLRATGAYCLPVMEEHREPMVGGAPT